GACTLIGERNETRRIPPVSSSSTSQFGQNQWLVEEMYQRYKEDPSSVDASWHEFLADYTPGTKSGNNTVTTPATPAPAAKAPAAPAPAAQKPAAPAAKEPAAPAAKAAAPAAKKPASQSDPKKAEPKPAAKAAAKPEPGSKALRGAAATVARNMDASLSIPTATSVRAVPAKLMIDNRIVLNNHLGRTRGGKVSFTHLLGYAIVRALADVPAMNNHYSD